MPDDPATLRPATTEELEQALAHALRFRGRKRVHDADPLGAQLVAERLIEALRQSGFVVMKRPPAPPLTTAQLMPPLPETD